MHEHRYSVLFTVRWLDAHHHAMLAVGFPEFLDRWGRWVTNNVTKTQLQNEIKALGGMMEAEAAALGTVITGKFQIVETSRSSW